MAYINAESVKEIREALKALFPEFKFSVRKQHNSSLHVDIMRGPIDFDELFRRDDSGEIKRRSTNINHFHLGNYGEFQPLFEAIVAVMRGAGTSVEWFDESDAMIDYSHTAYYINFGIGKWDRDYEYKPTKKPYEFDARAFAVAVKLMSSKTEDDPNLPARFTEVDDDNEVTQDSDISTVDEVTRVPRGSEVTQAPAISTVDDEVTRTPRGEKALMWGSAGQGESGYVRPEVEPAPAFDLTQVTPQSVVLINNTLTVSASELGDGDVDIFGQEDETQIILK